MCNITFEVETANAVNFSPEVKAEEIKLTVADYTAGGVDAMEYLKKDLSILPTLNVEELSILQRENTLVYCFSENAPMKITLDTLATVERLDNKIKTAAGFSTAASIGDYLFKTN